MTDKIEYKPWEEYPELWKTEAEFWSYLRGALRRGVWEKSPIKLSFKNANCDPPPEGYTGKSKSGQYCALSGEWTGKSKLQVDHKDGNKSLLSWEDVLPFILHLIPPNGSLQLVANEAHKIKSYAERMGISFEEAVVEKRVIKTMKEMSRKDLDKLLEKHGLPCNNDKVRRESLRKLIEEGK